MKALCWKKFDVEKVKIKNKEILVEELSNSSTNGTGLILWDSAIVLAKYFESSNFLESKIVLDLGAGVGYLSCVAALLDAKHIIATDLSYTFPNMLATFEKNKIRKGRIELLEFDWFRPEEFVLKDIVIDYIIASDVIWKDTLIKPLVSALDKLFTLYPRSKLILANQTRSTSVDNSFFDLLAGVSLTFKTIDKNMLDKEYRVNNIEIYEIWRKN